MAIVLCYHHVSRERGSFTSSPELFREHLLSLRDEGFRFLSFEQFQACAERRFMGSRKQILVTTDDGYADNWFWAYPVLRELGIPSVFFLITSQIADGPARLRSDQVADPTDPGHWPQPDQRLTWSEIQAMSAEGLVSMQSHTASHRDLASLLGRPAELQSFVAGDVAESRRAIETTTGLAPVGLAWPWGFNTRITRESAARTGFRYQFSVVPGNNSVLTHRRLLYRYCCDGLPTARLLRMTSVLSAPIVGDVYSIARLAYNRLRSAGPRGRRTG